MTSAGTNLWNWQSRLLQIVPDDQRLAVLDMFLDVVYQQPVSDPLIFCFFGFRWVAFTAMRRRTMRQAIGILAVKFYLNRH